MKNQILCLFLLFHQVASAQSDTYLVNGTKFISVRSTAVNEFGRKDTLANFYRIENGKPKYLLQHYIYRYSADCNNEFKDYGTIRVQHDSILFLTDYWQKTGLDPIPDKGKLIYRVGSDGKMIKVYGKQPPDNSVHLNVNGKKVEYLWGPYDSLNNPKYYSYWIVKGNNCWDLGQFRCAFSAYSTASKMHAVDSIVKYRIDYLESRDYGLACRLKEKYMSYIAKGDAAFKAQDFNSAKLSYEEALSMKPAEPYPRDKIRECDRLIPKPGQISSYYYPNGKKSCEIIQLDTIPDAHRHIIYSYENGQKKQEFYDRNRIAYDTLKEWNQNGHITSLKIFTDTGYISTEYYEDGKILEKGEYKVSKQEPEMIVVYDSTTFDKYITSKCGTPCYIRTGIWRTYHPNGALESEGEYLPMRFDVAYPTKDSSGIMVLVKKTSFEFMGSGVGCSTYLKDGAWEYFDDKGQRIKRESYKSGKLVKQNNKVRDTPYEGPFRFWISDLDKAGGRRRTYMITPDSIIVKNGPYDFIYFSKDYPQDRVVYRAESEGRTDLLYKRLENDMKSDSIHSSYDNMCIIDGCILYFQFEWKDKSKHVSVSNYYLDKLVPVIDYVNNKVPKEYRIAYPKDWLLKSQQGCKTVLIGD